mgnify:CR=1 FL=1
MDYKEVYEQWIANPYFDEATKEELKSIAEDENEIKERFYMDLELVQLVFVESLEPEPIV